jgi:putative DNA primase/helicase
MGAEAIAKALGGRKVGGSCTARCPAHEDRNPSLSIHNADEGKVLVCCPARCDRARVLEACGFVLCGRINRKTPSGRSVPHGAKREQTLPIATTNKRTEAGMRIWREARQLTGTLVEVYLRTRGITLSVPVGLGFHAVRTIRPEPFGRRWSGW